jgi:hypothetical protein
MDSIVIIIIATIVTLFFLFTFFIFIFIIVIIISSQIQKAVFNIAYSKIMYYKTKWDKKMSKWIVESNFVNSTKSEFLNFPFQKEV